MIKFRFIKDYETYDIFICSHIFQFFYTNNRLMVTKCGSVRSHLYPLPGFVLLRNYRILGRGCGVAIDVRADLPFKIISQSPNKRFSVMGHLLLNFEFTVRSKLGLLYSSLEPPSTVSLMIDSYLLCVSILFKLRTSITTCR